MSLSEYVDDMQKSDDTGGTSVAGNNGNTGSEPVINPEREVKKALAAGVTKSTIFTYFYPEVTVERMSLYRKK